MQGVSLTQRLVRDERFLPACVLLTAAALAWVYLFSGAGTLEDMGGMSMPMSSGPWDARHGLVMLLMWVTMMAAMMLPSAMPMILFFAMIARTRRARGERPGSPGLFVMGYLGIWSAFSVAAVLLQFVLEKIAVLSPMMQTTSAVIGGGILVAAGIYQWTPFKQACLSRCRSPLAFVLEHWREGQRGAFVMGIVHGAYCVGCCWAMMMILFVGGLMNMAWIVALTVLVLVEKLLPGGAWLGRLAGLAFIAWGAGLWFGALH